MQFIFFMRKTQVQAAMLSLGGEMTIHKVFVRCSLRQNAKNFK